MDAFARNEEDVPPGEESFLLESQKDLEDEMQLLVDGGRSKSGKKETRSFGALVRPSRSGGQRANVNFQREQLARRSTVVADTSFVEKDILIRHTSENKLKKRRGTAHFSEQIPHRIDKDDEK